MSEYDKYIEHFPVGLKVNVGIPVPGGNVFHDWAIIHDINEDLVELQLSRDVLPAGVRLSMGAIIDIRAGKEDAAYSCRAIIVEEGYQRSVLLRLIGEIVSDELREFYRIDAFLPIKYFVTSETSENKLKKFCIEKRDERIAEEAERKLNEKKPWERLRLPHQEEMPEEEMAEESSGEDSGEGLEETPLEDTKDHRWDDVVPLAANISGSGVRMLMHRKFSIDDLVPLEIFLPLEPDGKVVDALGKVVFANENIAAERQMHKPSFNTGIQFIYIDDRDQDSIVNYISNVQLKRIRLLREKYLGRGIDSTEPEPTETEKKKQSVFRILQAVVVIAMLAGIMLYFKNYSENPRKNEIEVIFEKGFMDYLKKIGRN